MPPGIVSLMALASAVSSLDSAKSPVGVVSSIILAGAVSSRLEPAAILSIIAVSTLVAGDGPSVIIPSLIIISRA